uniref:Sulfotransferase n=2 Tax=Aegilops tauschii TaxID=37682 RepID=A0A453QTZ1_AEGTS
MELEFGRSLEDGRAGGARVGGAPFTALTRHTPALLSPATAHHGGGVRLPDRVHLPDPKDAFISSWFFTKKEAAATAARAQAGEYTDKQQTAPPRHTFEEAFELFCDGKCVNGPQWRHVLGYLEESMRRPEKVLFLRYEEMLRDPARNVKKLAEFMRCAFSREEEADGVVHAIVELCSLESLKNMAVNKIGSHAWFASWRTSPSSGRVWLGTGATTSRRRWRSGRIRSSRRHCKARGSASPSQSRPRECAGDMDACMMLA